MVCGVIPATFIGVGILFVLLCVPYLAYEAIIERRRIHAEKEAKKNMIKNLFRTKWSPTKLNDLDSCIICMESFNRNTTVIVMPCNVKHSFHEICISGWLDHKTVCPNCRAPITPENIEKTQESYKDLFQE